MNLITLLQGVADKINKLQTNKTTEKDHSAVNSFQNELKNWLNSKNTTHNWSIEKTDSARKENDSIDIYGKPNSNNENECEWIIEIDATRADQVAKKMLSRFYLWGMRKNKPITYIALLYPDTQEGRNPSKKFIYYGYKLIHAINENNKVYCIILGRDKKKRNSSDQNSNLIVDDDFIEVYDPSKKNHFNIIYKNETKNNVEGMDDCAKETVLMYLEKNNNTSYDELREKFKKYIANQKGPSRYKDIKKKTSDKKPIYTYTQFRQYGNWQDFEKLCKNNRIIINKLVCCFVKGELSYYENLTK